MSGMDDDTTVHLAAYEERNGGFAVEAPSLQHERLHSNRLRHAGWSLAGAVLTAGLLAVFLV